jgi:anaerobic selenocysteine-containing dehydrogenase
MTATRTQPDTATATRTVDHTCHLCESMCGITLGVQDDKILSIRPNKNDSWSHGHICPKGMQLAKFHEDPDRVRTPLLREGDQWREATWAEAFAKCEEIIHGVIERHGKPSLVLRTGNMVGHNFSLMRYIAAFAIKARIVNYSSSTVDQQPKNVACDQLYGDSWAIPVPDIAHTDLWVIMGGNPAASNGSILAYPDVMGEIRRIRERGGATIVIDPVRTGTAKAADDWIPIIPGTDAAFLLAVVQVLFADDLVDLKTLAGKVNGVEEMRRVSAGYTPESVTAACGVPADWIRRFAHQVAGARTAAVYGRIGLCTQEFGTLASWLTEVVAILTGNLDSPGGMMFPNPVAPFRTLLPRGPGSYGAWHSRVRGAPEVLGQVPSACLAEEIDTPGAGQLKGLITMACNPVISAPDSGRLDEALGLLEGMISVDAYINETTRHADVILPASSPLEQPFFDVWSWIFALTSGAKWHDPVFSPPEGWVEEWEILLRLGGLCAGLTNDEIDIKTLDDEFFSFLCGQAGFDPATILAISPVPGPLRLCDLTVRAGPWGDRYGENPDGLTLEKIRSVPDATIMGHAEPQIDDVLRTASGKIELAPPYILADLDRLDSRITQAAPELQLIGRRHVRTLNSWMHNLEPLARGRGRWSLHINPIDADRLGLVDGEPATVTSSSGSVTTPVEITDDISPGVVSIPHGWGHGAKGTRTNVARQHPGVNTNILSPGDLIDTVSGNAVLNGIPVTIEAGRVEHSAVEHLKEPHDLQEIATSIDIIVGSAG